MHTEASKEPLKIEVVLRDGERVVAKGTATVPASEAATEPMAHSVPLTSLGAIKLWDLMNPNLYTVHVRLLSGGKLVDQDSRRIGFREAIFTEQGFFAERQGDQAARIGPSPDISIRWTGDARPRATQRRQYFAQEDALQYREDLALSAIAAFSGCLRRDGLAGA